MELVLATTTFKKEGFVTGNIELVRRNIVESGEDIADHFNMYVMDNGRTLNKRPSTPTASRLCRKAMWEVRAASHVA